MKRRRVLMVAAAICLVGSVIGWHVIGDWFIADLQVEYPETNGYEEYVLMRDASPWAGAIIGFLICVGVLVVAWATLRLRRRIRHTDPQTVSL